MTYFGFLFIFLVLPIITLTLVNWRMGTIRRLPVLVIGLHIVIAVLWTTPWDNYLVATRVWWYDPALVHGALIGYVPIEEYTFFVLQPIFTGLWLLFLMALGGLLSATTPLANRSADRTRMFSTLFLGVIWLASAMGLLLNVEPATYLSLELIWALPPLMLQCFFGADILRRQWRLVVFTIASATIYLSLADTLAIHAGTWTISPTQSTGLLLGGILPVEELIFFLLTNALIVCGVTLALSPESLVRLKSLMLSKRLYRWIP